MFPKKKKPLVSIIMNCYNGEKYLEASLTSIINQTYKNYELIFYDNNSDDNSALIAKKKIPDLKYFKSKKKDNLGTVRQNALNLVNGEYVAFLDCDDIWLSEHLFLAVNFLENNQDYNLTYNNVSLINNNNKIIKDKIFKKIKPSGRIFRELLSSYFLTIATVVIRKTFLKDNNLNFNKKYDYINDVDLFTRISYLTNIKYLNIITAKVRIHENRLTSKNFFLFHKEHLNYLEELKIIIYDFEVKYKNEITYLKNNLKYQEGLLEWKLKKYNHSRKKILECSKINIKYFIVYLLTFCIEYDNFKKIFIKNL